MSTPPYRRDKYKIPCHCSICDFDKFYWCDKNMTLEELVTLMKQDHGELNSYCSSMSRLGEKTDI